MSAVDWFCVACGLAVCALEVPRWVRNRREHRQWMRDFDERWKKEQGK